MAVIAILPVISPHPAKQSLILTWRPIEQSRIPETGRAKVYQTYRTLSSVTLSGRLFPGRAPAGHDGSATAPELEISSILPATPRPVSFKLIKGPAGRALD
jgi:hypothetical protein